MYVVLSSNSANPVVIIIFFVVIIGLSLLAVKSGGNSGAKNIKKLYAGKVKDEAKFDGRNCFFTDEVFVIQSYYAVHKEYKLDEIKMVGVMRDNATRSWCFAVTDENKKPLKGNAVGGTKAARKMMAGSVFQMREKEAQKCCDWVIAHLPNVQRF